MQLLTPKHWTDYELIDTGNHEKLERFGRYILIRSCPNPCIGIPDLVSGELFIPDRAGPRLPLGTFLRFRQYQPK